MSFIHTNKRDYSSHLNSVLCIFGLNSLPSFMKSFTRPCYRILNINAIPTEMPIQKLPTVHLRWRRCTMPNASLKVQKRLLDPIFSSPHITPHLSSSLPSSPLPSSLSARKVLLQIDSPSSRPPSSASASAPHYPSHSYFLPSHFPPPPKSTPSSSQ